MVTTTTDEIETFETKTENFRTNWNHQHQVKDIFLVLYSPGTF